MATISFVTDQPSELRSSSLNSNLGLNSTSFSRIDHKYTDLNNDFTETRGQFKIHDTAVIKAEIRNVLSTPLGSEPFEPEYGSLLPLRLFEPLNGTTTWNIENDTVHALTRWMSDKIIVDRSRCSVIPFTDDSAVQSGYLVSLFCIERYNGAVEDYSFRLER